MIIQQDAENRKKEYTMKKKLLILVLVSALALVMGACGADPAEEQNEQDTDAKATETETSAAEVSSAGAETETTDTGTTDMKMKLFIDDQEVSVEWENNEAVSALAGQVKAQPLTIDMSMYDDFEQVGELGTSLPAEDVQMETKPGDIMLYAGDKIVVFYGTNSWAYTPLGKIKDKTEEELAELLGQHDVTITLKQD